MSNRPPPGVEEIRLFRILPGRSKPSILIEKFALEECPPFEAISFSWDGKRDVGLKDKVLCEGEDISVPNSLMQCLLQLRRDGKTAPLYWAFSIVGQKTDDILGHGEVTTVYGEKEVSVKVTNLAWIFAMAARTLCWVGTLPSQPRGLSAVDVIPVLCEARRAVLGPAEDSDPEDGKSCSFEGADPVARLVNYQRSTESLQPEAWQALNELLGRRFFSRPWVLLEILSAQHLVVLCGPREVLWDDFCSALEACDLFKCPSAIKPDGLQMLLAAQAYRRLLGAGPSQNRLITEIFAAFDSIDLNAFDSPEPPQVHEKYWQRDGDAKHKIQAVNCLLQKRFGRYLAESLTGYMDVSVMFKVASWGLNQTLGRPFTLSLAGSTNPQEDWPSWVPNWRVFRIRYLLDAPAGCFNASAAQQRDMTLSGPADQRLRFTGLVVGTVRGTADYLPPRRHSDHYEPGGANSIFFWQWFTWAEENAPPSPDRLPGAFDPGGVLLEFAETIQAKGCGWKFASAMPTDPAKYTAQARKFLAFLEDEGIEESYDIKLFYAACYPSHGRTFGITSQGRFCLLPQGARTNDLICIPHGNNVPVVLRSSGGYYHNLGECYVHGMMHGEAYDVVGFQTRQFEVR